MVPDENALFTTFIHLLKPRIHYHKSAFLSRISLNKRSFYAVEKYPEGIKPYFIVLTSGSATYQNAWEPGINLMHYDVQRSSAHND